MKLLTVYDTLRDAHAIITRLRERKDYEKLPCEVQMAVDAVSAVMYLAEGEVCYVDAESKNQHPLLQKLNPKVKARRRK